MADSASPNLLSLPDELLIDIARLLNRDDPSTLGVFNKTCRRINDCCAKYVELRQDLQRKFKSFVVSDRIPLDPLILFKSVFDDPMGQTWHFRRAEIWGYRENHGPWCHLPRAWCVPWDHAVPYVPWDGDDEELESTDLSDLFDLSELEDQELLQDESMAKHMKQLFAYRARVLSLFRRDKSIYRMMLEKRYNLDEAVSEQLTREEEHEHEAEQHIAQVLLPQALLIPLCHNLDTLVFPCFAATLLRIRHPVTMLNWLISQCYRNQTNGWFPGFESLRKISINSETNARNHPSFGETEWNARVIMYPLELDDIEPLFALPNLKALRLAGVVNKNSWESSRRNAHRALKTPRVEMRRGTSSVEMLEIARSPIDFSKIHHLLSLPRQLRYFVSDITYTPAFMRGLHGCPAHFIESLERFTFQSSAGGNLWVLANYVSLRRAEGLTADCFVWETEDKPPPPNGPQETFLFPVVDEKRKTVEDTMVVLEDLGLCLPPNVETLSIRFSIIPDTSTEFLNAFIRELLHYTTGMKEANGFSREVPLPRLQKLTFVLQNGSLPDNFEWDEDARAGLEARGIHVSHTQILSTASVPEFQEVDDTEWEHCLEDKPYAEQVR